ncbi:MAG: DNA-processing protein DprA [Planctomycetales bacterium]
MTDSDSTAAELIDWLRLNLVPGVGPRTLQALLERFATPAGIFAARPEELRQVDGIGPKVAAAIVNSDFHLEARRERERCRDLGVELLLAGSEGYPRLLQEIFDPPGVLYFRGTREPRDDLAIAIVGARRCTHYGRQQAERFAGTLARAGMTVVSGLARGIDAAAHRGALAAGGRTIAVLATGVATIYPPEHVELADEVIASGALVSESPLDQRPMPGLFPQRNRIISGLSAGVIIVEASRKSGALHTARHAMEQGRDVFAIPGSIDSLASEGCHDLIRDGVALVRTPDDVLEALGPLISPVQRAAGEEIHSPRELTLNEQERTVLDLVQLVPRHTDEVLRDTDLEPSRVLATLTILEMKRMVRRLPGGYVVRTP